MAVPPESSPYGMYNRFSFSILNIVVNYLYWAEEFHQLSGASPIGDALREVVKQLEREQQQEIVLLTEVEPDARQSLIDRVMMKDLYYAETKWWDNPGWKTMLTCTNRQPIYLPQGQLLLRRDVAERCARQLAERGLALTQPGDFETVEEIVRWLGYGRLYDAQEECLFTGIDLNQSDIDLEQDVVETRIIIPLLDTVEAPLARIHRSALQGNAWLATREGCSIDAPHILMDRYKNEDPRTQVCHVTGIEFQRPLDWFNNGHPLIPICPAVEYESQMWLDRNETGDGLPATEWSTRWLQPRIGLKEST